jgi:choline dehydrogenase-like flavoprotein
VVTDDRRVVVIGSGPSGASAARELIRNGIPVTMLESGSEPAGGVLVRVGGRNVFRRTTDLGVVSEGKHVVTGDPKTKWWSSMALGGLSNQWTGAVPRFAPEDFTEGERINERYRWPVTYEDLAPHYAAVEKVLKVSGSNYDVPNMPAGAVSYPVRMPRDWQKIAGLAEARGQGLAMLPLADGPPWMVVRRGTAFNSFVNVVQPLLNSPDFKLIRGAHALRLEWNGAERRVTDILYRDRENGSEHRISAKAVIVACGPIDSARLLFSSACSDFSGGLGNTEGVLGRYLHDHPREWWVFDLAKPIAPPCPAIYLTRTAHHESPPLFGTSWTIGAVDVKDKLRSFVASKTHCASVQMFGTMIPQEKYYVKPHHEEKDEFGIPKLDIHICYDEDTVCNVVKGRDRLLSLLNEAGHGCKLREIVPQLYPGSSVHYGGTVRMHESPKYGMLDAWNRLHAVPNVLVVDASAFTTGPEKNPTLTAMALATRAAARLARDLKAGQEVK